MRDRYYIGFTSKVFKLFFVLRDINFIEFFLSSSLFWQLNIENIPYSVNFLSRELNRKMHNYRTYDLYFVMFDIVFHVIGEMFVLFHRISSEILYVMTDVKVIQAIE